MIKTFRELVVWKKAHELTLCVYQAVIDFPKFEEYGLSNQMRRSSSSVPSNIAEGFRRRSNKDSLHFYNIAAGSLEELKYQLILSKDLKYIDQNSYAKYFDLAEEVSKLINGWSKSQLNS